MDIRQLAFLARQPSAHVQSREHFWGLPKRGLALILANAMFWQPLLANADGIVVSAPGTSLGAAGNGVPIVNIAAPNGSGLSHNQFKDYNVGANGVILNNATERTQSTQLGGIILGNPNLKGGAANIILNEVNGGSPSQLRGYTEVAGQSAKVIVANPYGISCNGCGFINTPNVTLTTGKPILDNGRLDRYQVDGGAVTFDGQGLNASNVDRFEIITRSAQINAQINARHLTVIAGRNDVNAQTLHATARADDGSAKPQLAIDSSALGGMYAGAIKLVGTEAGVGVKLDGTLAASGGDIQLDANGQLTMAQAKAENGAINLKAASVQMQGPVHAGTTLDVNSLGDLHNQNTLSARDRITLASGGQLSNSGIIESGVNLDLSRNTSGDLSLSAQTVNNNGNSLIASRNLTVNAAHALNNQGGTLSAKQSASISAGTLDNQNQGRVLSTGSLDLNASQWLNAQGGLVTSSGPLSATVGHLNNRSGEVSSLNVATLNIASLDNVAGLVMANTGLRITASGAVNNQGGKLTSRGTLNLTAGAVDNSATGHIASNQALIANVASLDNSDGLLSSRGITGVSVDGAFVNQGGTLISDGNARVSAASLLNSKGQVASKGDLTANVAVADNQNGQLIAEGALVLEGTTLDNRSDGLVAATQGVQLKVGDVDNRGGEISSKAAVSLQGQTLNNADGGRVIAEQALKLAIDKVLNHSKGLFSTQAAMSLAGSSLDNSGGRLLSQKDLSLALSGGLNNSQGLLNSEGQLSVEAASLDNRQGRLSSAGLLQVTSAGAVDNQGGELVTDAALTLNSASLDNSQKGTLSSKAALNISTGAFDNSHAGNVSTLDTLDISAAQLTNQSGGRLTSSNALTATVSGLDQQGGKLFSTTSVALDLNHGQLNNQGGLINAPLLMLKNLKGVNNQGGEISSAQAFTLTAESLDNSSGKLLGNQALTLRITQALNNLKGLIAAQSIDGHAARLDNSGGTLTSRGETLLNIDGLLTNQNQGLINAANTLTLNSSGLNNQQGTLSGAAVAIDLGTATGDVNNNAGLISSAGPLTFKHLRDLHNQAGEISTTQHLNLAGRTLDNSSGKLISNQQLTLGGHHLNNQGGLLSGWQGVSVSGVDLDNRNQGTVSSRYGNVDATLSNRLLNSGAGALVSQQTLSVSAASLDNSDKGILSSAGGQTLTVTGLLNNTQGGLIDSGAALDLNAHTLNNADGTVNAQHALSLTGTSLDNSAGSLIGNGAVTLDLLGGLNNTQGKLASAGALLLKRASEVNNQGGQLASQGLLTLLAGSLDNRNRGTVAANGTLLVTTSGAVQNSGDGLIYSQNADLQLKAASLDNAKGSIQSQAALNLDISGALDNQSGKVITQTGDADINAATIDNRGGSLASLKGALQAKALGGWLRNDLDLNNHRQAGIIQAQRLNLNSASLNNNGGRIAAQSGDTVVTTGAFDNRDGGLYAKGAVKVIGSSFDNSGDVRGQVAGGQVDLNLSGALNNQKGVIESDSTLSVSAGSVDNQKGQLRALGASGTTRFEIGGVFDNRDGTLETANSDLTLNAGAFQNAGGSVLHVGTGTLGISMANLTGAGGNLVTRGGLTLDADTWTNSSVIQAGRLTLNVNTLNQTAGGQLLASESLLGRGGNWSNDGLIASDGSLKLTLGGTYSGSGRASSQGIFALNAAQVNVASAGSLAGGGNTLIEVGGQLTNYGRVTSNTDLTVNADTLLNYGTLAGAQGLSARAVTLRNGDTSPDTAALVFSGADMKLQVANLTNTYSDIYSFGTLAITGDELSRANKLENISATIESQGDMQLDVQDLINRKDKLTYENKFVSGNIGVSNYYTGTKHRQTNYFAKETYRASINEDSMQSMLQAGGDLTIQGGNISNNYSTISATGNINIGADKLLNEGAVAGESVRARTWYSGWAKKKSDYAFISNYVNPYNAKTSPTAISEQAFNNYTSAWGGGLISDVTTASQAVGSALSPAIIQAGGTVVINASQNLINSSITEFKRPEITSQPGVDTAAGGGVKPVVVQLNAQLPPDLAQQQVNPLTLPGFDLPAGQNGLFRLSQQEGSAPTTDAPQQWAMGNAAISTEQREQAAPGNPIQWGDISQPGTEVTAAGTQTINRVQGLPSNVASSRPHKYLIETNPALTDLKQFMSSDYLLSKLGYNPDDSWKRLGDGFYEQRLIQQAVVARTGQRFLAGQNTDEQLFKYLMDNAIKSKQQLNLAVGVTLTSAQVAALTHDIVWLEQNEVNGEQVLVPVLYLAHSNNRLAPNGALIAGNNLNLIAGANLDNAGTLRATNSLSAQAGANLVNSGLIEAGNRLDLIAGNNLVNKAGGIIAGRDVSLKAVNGDVVNERTATRVDSQFADHRYQADVVDNAARIEAANTLSIQAGRDVNNIGGGLKSGTDLTISAGRDVNIASAEQLNDLDQGRYHRNKTVTQFGSTLEAGRDLKVEAGRDIKLIASQIDAKRDIAMTAGDNLLLSSAADEQHSYDKTRKVTKQEDHVQQVSTSVKAGGDVALSAGEDLALIASRVAAGNEAYLVAGKNLVLNAAEDQDYSFYSKTKKSSSGKKFRLDETDSTSNVGSLVSAGTNSMLVAGENLLVQGSAVSAEKGAATLLAGNDVQILAVSDSSSARHESSKSKKSWGGLKSSKVKDQVAETQTTAVGSVISGNTVDVSAKRDATVTGSALVSTQDLKVQAGRDLSIDAAENTFTRNELHKQKNRDLTGALTGNNLGLDDITGNQHLSISSNNRTSKAAQTTLTGSTVGSSEGNVTLEAGRELKVVASDLVSTKDMSLVGSNVTIAAGMETASQSSTDKSKSLAVGRVVGGMVVDTAKSIRDGIKAAKDADDPRLKAVKLAQVALSTYNLGGQVSDANSQKSGFQDKQGGTASNGSLIKIGTELGSTRSKSSSEYSSQTAKQSTLNAGKELSVVATGKAEETRGDIHIVGSDLKADSTTLVAKNDITLESAQNTTEQKNNSKNDKTSIGASFNIGEQNGFTLDLGAQIAKSMGTGSSVTQVNSKLETGALVLKSGQDTKLAGAQVQAESIKADIGGDLNIASRQDTDTQKSKQGSAGVGASICVPPFCYGAPVAASGSVSAGNMNSDYKAVTDQTGLYAGKDGYSIDVGKNTILKGAVIASEASADKNLLITDRLLTSDIKNTSKIKSTSVSAGISGGPSGIGMGPPMGMVLSESDSSKTRAAVSEGTILVRNPDGANDLVGLNRDTANANKPLDKPDEKAMRERMDLINSSAELARNIGSTIAKAKIDESEDPNSDMGKAARQKLLERGISDPTTAQVRQQAERDYGVGSSFQRTTQVVTAIVQGIAGGNLGAAIAGTAAPYLAQTVKEMTSGDDTANLMAHAVLGAVLARAGGNSALVGAGGAIAAEVTARLIRNQLYAGISNEDLTPEQKQTISALSTLAAGIAGSAVGKDALSAVAGAQIGKNAVENNLLSDEKKARLQVVREAQANGKATVKTAQELISLDQENQISDALVERLRRNPESMSDAEKAWTINYLLDYTDALIKTQGVEKASETINGLTRPGPLKKDEYVAYAAGSREKDASLERIYGGDTQAQMFRTLSQEEQLYHDAQGKLRINERYQAEAAIGTPALYALGGSLGLAIKLVTVVDGSLQITYGAKQAYNGDTRGAATNIVLGALSAVTAGLPGALKAGVVGGKPKASVITQSSGSSSANWKSPVSQADGDFGAINQPAPIKRPAFFDPQSSAVGFVNSGRIKAVDLEKLIPPGVPDRFRSSATIADGSKFQYSWGGEKIEIKWHSLDTNAAAKFPGSNSGSGWTAQIKIGNKLLGLDGKLYRKPSDLTHIPVDF